MAAGSFVYIPRKFTMVTLHRPVRGTWGPAENRGCIVTCLTPLATYPGSAVRAFPRADAIRSFSRVRRQLINGTDCWANGDSWRRTEFNDFFPYRLSFDCHLKIAQNFGEKFLNLQTRPEKQPLASAGSPTSPSGTNRRRDGRRHRWP